MPTEMPQILLVDVDDWEGTQACRPRDGYCSQKPGSKHPHRCLSSEMINRVFEKNPGDD